MQGRFRSIGRRAQIAMLQTGLPISYAVGGRQFIVVAVGGPDHPGELVALALP
jgi:hypothetical protein